MARRRNAVFHRLSRMRGLPPEEKMLMQRIGHLLDAALNNRQASNPYEPSKNNPDRVLYPPTGLVAYTGYRTLKLVWTAADSDQHLRYEVKITNNETGVHETKTTYTNELRYKNVNGAYTAVVKSVGRDGSSSPSQTITFTMGGSVMQIEGSKNGPTELGTIVKDHITVYNNYSVYAWGSVVLNKYIAGSSNEEAVFRLYSMEGANQTFDADEATLQQTITMYPATESFACLDDDAHAALITRPTATRSGSFETSQSVMFSPISITTSEEEATFTFFLQALGRDTEDDEVNLSLVLWGGFDGLGDNVPQDPWDGGNADYVFPHLHSLRIQRRAMDGASNPNNVTDGGWYMASQAKEYNVIDNAWTLAFWMRLESEHIEVMVDDAGEPAKLAADNVIFRRSSYRNDGVYNWDHNFIEVSLTGVFDLALGQYPVRPYIKVRVGDKEGKVDNSAEFWTPAFGRHNGGVAPDTDDDAYLWGNDEVWGSVNYNWQFIVICFEGGKGSDSSPPNTSLTPKIRMYTSNRLLDGDNPDDRYFAAEQMCCLNQRAADGATVTSQIDQAQLLEELEQDLSENYIYSIGPSGSPSPFFTHGTYNGSAQKTNNGSFTIHQMGMWNVALDNWDGMGFNPGSAEQRDSSPWYAVPYTGAYNQLHTDGRENEYVGSSLTAIHYLYNQGYGTDIDWKKNSSARTDGAREYIFAENLIHLWQFGAIAEEFGPTSQALRDTGNYMYGGDVNFLRQWKGDLQAGANSNLWSDDCSLIDILSPVRFPETDPWTNVSAADRLYYPPIEWNANDGSPTGGNQEGIVQPEGHLNGAGYSDAGTTASRLAYPGWGPLTSERQTDGSGAGWRRPNTTVENGKQSGVLDESGADPDNGFTRGKTWGPVYRSGSLAQAETDNGW